MAHRTPWLGLLLWAVACAGLLVSLFVQADKGVGHENGLNSYACSAMLCVIRVTSERR
jgi:hypothetical protein